MIDDETTEVIWLRKKFSSLQNVCEGAVRDDSELRELNVQLARANTYINKHWVVHILSAITIFVLAVNLLKVRG